MFDNSEDEKPETDFLKRHYVETLLLIWIQRLTTRLLLGSDFHDPVEK